MEIRRRGIIEHTGSKVNPKSARQKAAEDKAESWLDVLLALRYLYYCQSISILSDSEYDVEEASFREQFPSKAKQLSVGSDKPRDYPEAIRALGLYFALKHHKPNHENTKNKSSKK
jgi:hypothetical protein